MGKLKWLSLALAVVLPTMVLQAATYDICTTQTVSAVGSTQQIETHWYFKDTVVAGSVGVKLVRIEPQLLSENPSLPAVIMGGKTALTVLEIGEGAFANFSYMTSVTLPNQILKIGDYAFSNCTALTSVSLGNNLRYIGKRPFVNTPISSITLPDTLLDMDGNISAGTLYNAAINISDSSHFAYSDDGYCLYNKDKTRLYACSTRAEGTVTLPPTLKEIRPDAFFGCFRLTYLNIPANVTTIGSRAFNVGGIWSDVGALEATPKLETVFYQGSTNVANAADDMYDGAPATLTSYAFSEAWTGSEWCHRPLKIAKGNASPLLSALSDGIEWTFRIVDNSYAEIYNDGEAAIPTSTKYGSNGYVSYDYIPVPSSLYGYPVNSVGRGAFRGCNVCSWIVIPSTVTKIDDEAFYGCSALLRIGNDSTSSNGINLPEGIETLGYRAFDGDSKFQKLVIPATITSISNNPIAGCKFISEIEVATANSYFTFSTPLLFNSTRQKLIACLPNVTEVTVPSTVTTLGIESFDGCSLMTQLTFLGDAPESAPTNLFAGLSRELKIYANTNDFANWSAAITNEPWKAIVKDGRFINTGDPSSGTTYTDGNGNQWHYSLKDDVITIKSLTPSEDSAIFELELPSSIGKYIVKTLAPSALANLRGITSITIPSTYESIGDYAFSNCTALASVTLAAGLRTIGKSPFYGTAITSLTIPNTVTTIDGNPLDGCAFLTAISVDAGNTAFTAENGLLYNVAKTMLRACVPSSTAISLPDTLTTLATNALAGCSRLASVTFAGDEPTAPANIFADTPASLVVKADAYLHNWGTPIPTMWKGRTFENSGTPPSTPPSGIQTYTDASGCTWTYRVSANGEASIGDDGTAIPRLTSGEVSIPDNLDGWPLTSVGAKAFVNCELITRLSIPTSVTSIAVGSFRGCTSLATFDVASMNAAYSSRNGALYSKNGTTLVKVPAAFRFATTVTCNQTGTSTSFIEVVNGFNANMQYQPTTIITESTSSVGGSKTVTSFTPEISSKTLTLGVTDIAEGAFADCGWLPVGTTARGTLIVTTDGKVVSTESGDVTLPVGTDSTNTSTSVTTATKSGFYKGKIAAWKTTTTTVQSYSSVVAKPTLSGIRYDSKTIWKNSIWADSGDASIGDDNDDSDDTVDANIHTGDTITMQGGSLQIYDTGLDSTTVKSVTAKGLPFGVRLVATRDRTTGITTWTLQGSSMKAATRSVTLTVTCKDKTRKTITFTIETLPPPAWLCGEFNGPIFEDAASDVVRGYATARITASGMVSGKLQMPSSDGKSAKTYTFYLKRLTDYDAETGVYSGTVGVRVGTTKKNVAIRCAQANDGSGIGVLSVDLGNDGYAELYQNIWLRSDLAAPNMFVNQRITQDGITFRILARGKILWSGVVTGDNGANVRACGTTQLFNDGMTTLLYVPPRRNLVGGRTALISF